MSIGSIIRRVALGAALFIAGSPVLLWLALYVPARISIARDTAAYPQKVFGDAVPYETVIASKAWFDLQPLDVFLLFGSGRLECTFAVVQLPTEAPPRPPAIIEMKRWRSFVHGDAPWQPGPTPWLDSENFSESD